MASQVCPSKIISCLTEPCVLQLCGSKDETICSCPVFKNDAHTELSHGNSSITLVVFHSRQRQDLLAIDTSKIMYKCLGILVAKVGTFSHFFLQ